MGAGSDDKKLWTKLFATHNSNSLADMISLIHYDKLNIISFVIG